MYPPGMLSLTYHLTFDNVLTQRWRDGEYIDIFNEFGIDQDQANAIQAINAVLQGAADEEQVVRDWMELLYDEMLSAKRRLW